MKFIYIILLAHLCNSSFLHAQDSPQVKADSLQADTSKISTTPPSYKGWKIIRLMQFGIGFGSGGDKGYGKKSTGLVVSMELVNLAWSIPGFYNIALGASLFEAHLGPAIDELGENTITCSGAPCSWLPVYLYYPLYSSEKKLKNKRYPKVRSPFIYAFAGGSFWGLNNNYIHAGVNAVFWTFEYKKTHNYYTYNRTVSEALADAIMKLMAAILPMMDTEAQAGIFYAPPYDKGIKKVNGNFGFYLRLNFGFGATL